MYKLISLFKFGAVRMEQFWGLELRDAAARVRYMFPVRSLRLAPVQSQCLAAISVLT